MSRLQFAQGDGPGQYEPFMNLDRYSGATLFCPDCGKGMSIHRNHTISDGGIVTPSIVCPQPGCGFHDFGDFVGWLPLLRFAQGQRYAKEEVASLAGMAETPEIPEGCEGDPDFERGYHHHLDQSDAPTSDKGTKV